MAITFSEFDTTPAGLIAALKAAILASADWADYGVVQTTTTSTGATTAAGNTVTLTSVTNFAVGSWITVQPGATEVTRQIASIAGNVITINGTWGSIYASGTSYRTRGTVLHTTTDGGAKLIVDLEGSFDAAGSHLGTVVYRDWTSGTTPGGHVDGKNYFTYFRNAVGAATMPIHVTLSAGKNHLFFSLEGPRATEANPTSTTYGSMRNYFAVSELTPYHVEDEVPAVVAIGNQTQSATPSVNTGSHLVGISRDTANAASWTSGRLASLDWPTVQTTDVVTMPRNCTIDGSTYLFPFVVFSEAEGIRGRLGYFFYTGTTAPTALTDLPEPVGSKVTYDGVIYRLTAVNKGDGGTVAWGPFGSVANSNPPLRSVVVAVPFAAA